MDNLKKITNHNSKVSKSAVGEGWRIGIHAIARVALRTVFSNKKVPASKMVMKGIGRTETRPSWLDTFGISNPMILLLPTVLTGKS